MSCFQKTFAPYRVRPFEFTPTLCRVRPHTFRVRPYQVEFAPWLSGGVRRNHMSYFEPQSSKAQNFVNVLKPK